MSANVESVAVLQLFNSNFTRFVKHDTVDPIRLPFKKGHWDKLSSFNLVNDTIDAKLLSLKIEIRNLFPRNARNGKMIQRTLGLYNF